MLLEDIKLHIVYEFTVYSKLIMQLVARYLKPFHYYVALDRKM